MTGSVEHGAQPDTVVQRAYCCKHCGVQCRRPQDLRRHLLVHTDASFSCERCGHKFTRYDTLTRHKRDNCHGGSTDGQHRSQLPQNASDMSEMCDVSPQDAYIANGASMHDHPMKQPLEISVETSPTSRVPSQPQSMPPQLPSASQSQHQQGQLGQPHQPLQQQQQQPAATMLPSFSHAAAPLSGSVPQLSPLQTQSGGLAAGVLSFSPGHHQQPVQQVPPVQPISIPHVSPVPIPQMAPVSQAAHVSPPQGAPVPIQTQLVPPAPAHMTSGATAYLPQVVPFASSHSSKQSPTEPHVIDKGRGKPETWRNQPMEPNPIGLPPLFQPLRMLRHHSDAELEVQRQRFDGKLTLQISELEEALHKIHHIVGSLDSRLSNIESRLTHLETHLTASPQPQIKGANGDIAAAAPSPPMM